MARRDPDPVSERSLGLPACKGIALLLARQRVPAVSLPATQAHRSPDRIVIPVTSAQVRPWLTTLPTPCGPRLGVQLRLGTLDPPGVPRREAGSAGVLSSAFKSQAAL